MKMKKTENATANPKTNSQADAQKQAATEEAVEAKQEGDNFLQFLDGAFLIHAL